MKNNNKNRFGIEALDVVNLKTNAIKINLIAGLMGLLLTVSSAVAEPIVRVGCLTYTEAIIMSEMTSQYLEEKGFKVEENRGMVSGGIHQAMLDNQVDITWTYTGTVYDFLIKKIYKGETPDEIYSIVKAADRKNGIVWLDRSTANNSYALAMNREVAEEKNISSIEDLAKYQNSSGGLSFASDLSWHRKKDGLVAFEDTYKFKFDDGDVHPMEPSRVYEFLDSKKYDVGLVYTTDGRNLTYDLKILSETQNFFPPYHITPVIREELLVKHPELGAYLNDLSKLLTTRVITQLNSRVDIDKVYIWEAVEEFLISNGLLSE